jgi:hypothetical protein
MYLSSLRTSIPASRIEARRTLEDFDHGERRHPTGHPSFQKSAVPIPTALTLNLSIQRSTEKMSGGAVAMSTDGSDAGMFGKYYASKIGALREVSSRRGSHKNERYRLGSIPTYRVP